MKKIKEIIDEWHYDSYCFAPMRVALETLRVQGIKYKVYVVHLQTGLDVYIDEETYKQITCTQIFIDGKIKYLDDYPGPIMPCNDIKSVKVIQQEMWKLKNVICNGQFHEEFIVSKYGIEHIMEVK